MMLAHYVRLHGDIMAAGVALLVAFGAGHLVIFSLLSTACSSSHDGSTRQKGRAATKTDVKAS